MVRLRQRARFQTGRKETVINDQAVEGSAENTPGRHVSFQRFSSVRNRRIRGRSLLILMALCALVVVAIAVLA